MKKILIFLFLLFCAIVYVFASVASNEKKTFNSEKNNMELVTINLPNHAVLREPAKAVSFPLKRETKLFIQQLQTFFSTLKSPLGKPAGLAAPQVGYSLRVIIIQIPPEAKEKRKDVYDILPPTVLINPTYTPVVQAGENKDWEGCFSVPDKMGEVYRYNEIHYEAYTVEGKKISAYAKGFLARLLQHEVDHLNGKLYIDKLRADCRYGSIKEVLEIRNREKDNPIDHST